MAGGNGRNSPPAPAGPIGRVLVVEDSMLIALGVQDALAACGVADVRIAGGVAAALGAIAEALPDFALLDYNLGEETSEPVALALAAAGVPFCFATGYGDALGRIGIQPPCGVLKKPFSPADLREVLQRAAAP